MSDHVLVRVAQERGIYVAQSGFSFGLQIPVSAVITSVAGKKVRGTWRQENNM